MTKRAKDPPTLHLPGYEPPWWHRDDAGKVIVPGRVPDALLAAVGDLMHDLDRYYSAARRGEYRLLKILFGFPIDPAWTERALSGAGRREALRWELNRHEAHVMAMPPETRAVWGRATERNRRKHEADQEACEQVWMVVYAYLLRHGLSDIRQRAGLWNGRELEP